jgi:hypothetical protein
MSDCEIAQYYVCKERTARKAHECSECSAPINPGEKYLQVNGCWENRPDVFRQHLLCQQACEFVRDKGLNDDKCIYYGDLMEWYSDWIRGGFGNVHDDIEDRRKMWKFMLGIKRRERRATPPTRGGGNEIQKEASCD